MKVLLVQPDYGREQPDPSALLPSYPLNLLAVILRKGGHDVTVLDPPLSHALFKDRPEKEYREFLASLMERERFDAVGVSVYAPLRKEALRVMREAKRANRLCKVIAGGPHPTRSGEAMLLKFPDLIDYVCLGAAERSLPALLEYLGGNSGPLFKVPGIMYRQTKKHVRSTSRPILSVEIERLPEVRYDGYLEHLPEGLERAYVMSTRGCIHWCNFCSNLWKKVILHPRENVISEVRHLAEDLKVKTIVIYDDCFGMKPEHSIPLLEGIAELGLDIQLQAISRFDLLSEEFLEAFVKAGGRDLVLGLETGSSRLRRKMNKHLDAGRICEGAESIRERGLRMGLYLMFGFPGESDHDVAQTYRLVKKLEPEQVLATVFEVKPGDMLYEFGIKSEAIKPEDWDNPEPRNVSYLSESEIELSVGRAMLFEKTFNREILFPEHDSAAWIRGFPKAMVRAAVADAQNRLQSSNDAQQDSRPAQQ